MKTMRAKNHYLYLVGATFLAILWAVNYTPSQKYPNVQHLTPIEAMALIETGRTLIIDVREKDAFDKDHLTGAISVPIGELDDRMDEFEAYKTEEVVIYCNEGSTRGPRATDKMNKAGYTNAKNIEGGIERWRTEKLMTVKQ